MNQLKMTFGIDGLNQLGELPVTKRRTRRKKAERVDLAFIDEFLNVEKIEAFLTPQLNVKDHFEIGDYRCDWMSYATHDEVVLIKISTQEILQYEWFDTPEGAKSYYERSKKMINIFSKFKR